jgi:hypothetical protein
MRLRCGVGDEGQLRVEKPVAVGQLVIRLLPEEIHVLPLIHDRAQALACYARLQDLITAWAEQPELLAALCELGPQTAPAPHERRPT